MLRELKDWPFVALFLAVLAGGVVLISEVARGAGGDDGFVFASTETMVGEETVVGGTREGIEGWGGLTATERGDWGDGWIEDSIIIGRPIAHVSYTQTAGGTQEVCLDDVDLVTWLREPPYLYPSAMVFLTLSGEQALMFLRLTNGAALATEARVLYLYRFPVGGPDKVVYIAVADEQGCLTTMTGARVASIPDQGFAGSNNSMEVIYKVLKKIGAELSKRHKPRPMPVVVEYDI